MPKCLRTFMRVCVQVKILLDQYDIAGDRVLTFNEFSVKPMEGGRVASYRLCSAAANHV